MPGGGDNCTRGQNCIGMKERAPRSTMNRRETNVIYKKSGRAVVFEKSRRVEAVRVWWFSSALLRDVLDGKSAHDSSKESQFTRPPTLEVKSEILAYITPRIARLSLDSARPTRPYGVTLGLLAQNVLLGLRQRTLGTIP
jgi:hypothetical protein